MTAPWFGSHLSVRVRVRASSRGDKETWIRSKYVEKKFIQKLPEAGGGGLPLLRRASGRRTRACTHDRSLRPPLKPKPGRATLPRLSG